MDKLFTPKRIMLAGSILAVVAAVVVGGTGAFFSDSEESTSNIFTAGAIDLKVDAKSSYNGWECVDGRWVNSSDCQPMGDNLILNGGFEDPEVDTAQGWDIFEDGASGLEWTVDWVAGQPTDFGGQAQPSPALQELQENVSGWNAYEGNQYAELDSDWDGPGGSLNGEPAKVSIYQMIDTDPGSKYRLTYAFSPRPNTPEEDNELIVKVDGVEVATHMKAGGGDVDWEVFTQEFVATEEDTRVEFVAGGPANSFGVFLDAVDLHLMSCQPVVDGECDSSWELTDLGSTRKFFSFDDVKPGDSGATTVSLHVYNNDAYACLFTTNLTDDDEGLTEPEEQAGDDTDGVGNGELSEQINFFLWQDDGDNIWEQGEDKLDVPNNPGTAGALFTDGKFELFVPSTAPLTASSTEYIGMAWCAGSIEVNEQNASIACDASGMDNQAQSDSMSFDISLYVEQARNNDDFNCELPAPEEPQDLPED